MFLSIFIPCENKLSLKWIGPQREYITKKIFLILTKTIQMYSLDILMKYFA